MSTPSPMQRALWIWLFVLLILSTSGLFLITCTVLLLAFGGILFGVFLHGISSFLTKRNSIGYRVNFGIVLALMIALILGGAWMLGAVVLEQSANLKSALLESLGTLRTQLEGYQWAKEYLPKKAEIEQALQPENTKVWLMSGASQIGQSLGNLGTLLGGVFLMFIIGAYVGGEHELYTQGFLKLLPSERRQRGRDVLYAINRILRGWIRGQLISMTVIGVLTTIGMWILGVPQAITLGVLAALLAFIPNVGPVLAAIPQSLLALQVGPMTVLYVIGFNILLQSLESHLIYPLVQQQEADLPPALTVITQLLAAMYFGILGALLGAPLLATMMTLVQMLYVEETPGEELMADKPF